MITVQELIDILSGALNKEAVVCLCVDDFEFANISNKYYDDSQNADKDGVIGNFLLRLDSNTEVSIALQQLRS